MPLHSIFSCHALKVTQGRCKSICIEIHRSATCTFHQHFALLLILLMQLSSSHDAVHLVVIIHTVYNIYSESFICTTVEMTIPWSELGCKSFTFGTEYCLTEYHCTDSLLWVYIFFLSKKTFVRLRIKVSVLQITNMTTLATSCEELTHWKRP